MNSEQQMSKKTIVHNADEEDEIDLISIAKTLWDGRKTVVISLLVSSILGVLIAISTPNEYTASTIMVPQTGGKSQSSLSSLASLAGVDLGIVENAELSPLIYPRIVNSIPFKLELMKTKVNFSEYDKPVSLYDYFSMKRKSTPINVIKKYTIGLPGLVIGAFKKKTQNFTIPEKKSTDQPLKLSAKQNAVKNALDARISLEVQSKQGYLTLIVRMPEALAAAQVAKKAQELLQREIIKFKVEKSQANLNFIQERFNVVKAEAEGYQVNIAVNNDRYKNLTSSVPQVTSTRVQTRYTIVNTVYQELAKQLEQAKIQVKRDTPVFAIVDPVSVPLDKTKPNRQRIIMIWIIFGMVLGICIIFSKQYYIKFKTKWIEKY